MGVARLHPWMENVYTLRRGGARARRRHLQGHRRAVRPLGMAAAAEQAAERFLVGGAEGEGARAGVFGRDEFGAADAAALRLVGLGRTQREGDTGHAPHSI